MCLMLQNWLECFDVGAAPSVSYTLTLLEKVPILRCRTCDLVARQ